MNQKKEIINFIKHVADKNYAAADKVLQAVVNEKVKSRIRSANNDIANKTAKKS